nr:reverse transcriptase domain-containing protein [Tanacetum cinerariifolium]
MKQKVTQSFKRVGEIAFPQLATAVPRWKYSTNIVSIESGLKSRIKLVPATTSLTGFSGKTIWPLGQLRLLVTIGEATHSTKAWMNFMVVKSMSPYNGIIGRLGLKAIQAVPSTVYGMLKFPIEGRIAIIRSTILIPTECASVTTSSVIPREERTCPANFTVALHPNFPDQEVVIGGSLSDKGCTELCSVQKKNLDIFAWQPSDMTGVPRSVAEHRLSIREGYSPVRQKKRGQAPERARAIQAEHDGSWRMCVDFTDLNKACPQDCYPLLEIDWKVESLCGYPFKCSLDAYKGYHQIQLAEADEEKTVFHTGQGVYCYTKMPFGLKNAGATYQRLMDKAFESQGGRNIKVYVDDLVVKSYTEAEMMRDIEETFRTLHKVNMKLNPKKCSFGLAEGVFLGYVITPEGIKPCPDKTAAVLQLPSPRTIKEVQSLNGKLASLNRFLSKPRTSVKGQILADFLIEIPGDVSQAAPTAVTQEEPLTLFTDGSSCVDVSGAGLILINPEGVEFTYTLRFQFTASNNEAEYEALVAGLRKAARMGVKNVQEDGPTWMTQLVDYLKGGVLPRDKKEARKLRLKARQYELIEGVLYRRSFLTPCLRCVGPLQADYVMREIHEGSCSMHAGPRLRIDIAGPFLEGPGKVKFLIVVMDYFTKWIEAKAVAIITDGQVKKFIWDNIVCRFGIPGEIISDNGKQFADNPFKDWCDKLNITQRFATVKHPQSNGLVERANRSLGEGIKARLGEGNKNWVEELPHVLWVHRTMIKSSHAVDMVNNDKELRINLDLLEERRERAAVCEARAKSKMMKYYNARVHGVAFKPGDFVYRSNNASHAIAGGKLGPKWEGPYEVTEALGNGAYKLRSTDGTVLPRTWNVANLKQCYL